MKYRGETRLHAVAVGIDWSVVHKRLFAFALRRHRLSPEDAEQVVQEAILRFFDPAYVTYDAAIHGDVLRFLGSIVNSLVANQRRRPRTVRLPLAFESPIESAPSPEDHALAEDKARATLNALLERTPRDRIARGVLTLLIDGVTDCEEHAVTLGVPVAEIQKAMRRLKTHLETISKGTGGN